QALIELGPFRHAAAVDIVREMVDVREPGAAGGGRLAAPESLEAWKRAEIDVVDGVAVSVLRIAIDQIDQRIADTLDRRNIELARAGVVFDAPGAAFDQLFIRSSSVVHPKRHGTHARPMASREILRER